MVSILGENMEEYNNKFNLKKIISIIVLIAIIIAVLFGINSCIEEQERKEDEKRFQQTFGFTVYVSRYDKIHFYRDCSGMVYYTAMPFYEAMDSSEYVLCKKCWAEGTEGSRKLSALIREEERRREYQYEQMQEQNDQDPPDPYR